MTSYRSGVDSLLRPPIAFAHRGARAHAPENTLQAFKLALKLGASGLESDVWVTSDGVAVLDHDGVVRSGLRRRAISNVKRSALPSHVPSLADLYAECGADYHLSLDVKDPNALDATLGAAIEAGAADRLWLCHPDWKLVATWRGKSDAVQLVDSTRLRRIAEGPERRAASLANAGIDCLNMHWTDWNSGLVTLLHRFERCCFAWDAQQPHALGLTFAYGIDGVYSDHVDRLMTARDEQIR
ncbi:MAG: glycerophosphodiester phosphodiesterase [Acidimicrobiales bacterium]|nr:glycerophosphodiester phosphodiesterase [Acidimicrobiales bacterium]